MAELNSENDQGCPEPARGMRLVSEGKHFQLFDDEVQGKVLVLLLTSPDRFLTISMERPRTKLGLRVIDFVLQAFASRRSKAPLVLDNRSLMRLAEYLYRSKSRSLESLREYAWSVKAFCDYAGKVPDQLIASCLTPEGLPDPMRVRSLGELLDEWLGEMDAMDLASGSIRVRQAHVESFFRVNGLEVKAPRRYSLRVKYHDRAPRPEEVQRIIEVADLREKVMVMMLATSGMRIGTLLKLKYGHVKADLEAGKIPVHIHVEAEITKGKYADYDTFINDEAVHYLKLYLDERKRGTEKIPVEEITDDSPLFVRTVMPLKSLSHHSAKGMLAKVLYKAGLREKARRHHELRVHSLRKFFRTQLESLGVPRDYCEYMMGHKISTYHDIQMKGIEFLRNVYTASDLRIQAKEKPSLADVLKELIRARGEDPSRYLKAEVGSAIDMITPEGESEAYARAIWEMLRRDIVSSLSAIPEERTSF